MLPTPTNINTIHVPGDELLNFIAVQQWVQDKFGSPLPLLNGGFVLVPSRNIPELCSREVMAACGYGGGGGRGSSSSSSFAAAVAEVIPWRLRQVEGVEVGCWSMLDGRGCLGG